MPFKQRHAFSTGLLDRESAWNLGSYHVANFGGVNLAGAGTIDLVLLALPPSTAAYHNPDTFPAGLAAANGNRVTGSGASAFAVLSNLWVVHVGAGAIYNPPAGTTLQLKVVSTSGATFGAAVDNLSAAFALNPATNAIDPITITAPASRQLPYGATGGLIATQAALFSGDILYAELVTTGALNVAGNELALIADIS